MNISEDLLVRYLQGEYTSEELAAVKAWESQSDDNKRYWNNYISYCRRPNVCRK